MNISIFYSLHLLYPSSKNLYAEVLYKNKIKGYKKGIGRDRKA